MDFCLLLKIWVEILIAINLYGKYTQKLLAHAKQSTTDAKLLQKT